MDHYARNKKKNTKGFYIALGVCLIAIGVAAWTTYDSVSNFISPGEEISPSSQKPVFSNVNEAVDKTLNGVTLSAPSKPDSSAAPVSSKPEAPSEPAEASEPPETSKPSEPAEPNEAVDAPIMKTPDALVYPGGKTIIKNFSENPIYSETMKDWRAHTGMDFSGAEGDEIRAAAGGVVAQVYTDDFYGATVVLKHGELETSYSGLDQILVKEGDNVEEGQRLGTLAAADSIPLESADGVHLHFSVRRGEKWLDPAAMLK